MAVCEIVKVIPDYLQAIAIVVAGAWAYWKFVIQQQQVPAVDIDVDIQFIGTQDEKWVIEITSLLENKSPVRAVYKDFEVSVRYIEEGDKIEDGDEKLGFQMLCEKSINDRISAGKERYFSNVDYINPKQEFKHRYVTFVPLRATFVWVQCKFNLGKSSIKMNSQKITRVPNEKD